MKKAMTKAEIPKELSHLKVDDRGYAIPYFAPVHDGKPDFRQTDAKKIIECVEHNRCGICGKKLFPDYSYIITGPIGLYNQVASDAPMHRVCAEYALKACPHMVHEPTKRIIDTKDAPYLAPNKPAELMLVKCKTKYKWKVKERCIFGFLAVSHETYHYVNGVLEKK
jgi:hypothetical protein